MKPLANSKGVLLDESDYYGPKRFSQAVIEQFSEFGIELADVQNDIHGQMHVLAECVRECMRTGQLDNVRRVFDFLARLLDRSDLHAEIVNAITISFLMPGDFRKSPCGAQAWTSVAPRLRLLIENAV
jgi:hypothetical protein